MNRLRLFAIVSILPVSFALATPGTAPAGSEPTTARETWDSADLIALGSVHGIHRRDNTWWDGRFEPAIVFKGDAPAEGVPVRIYGPPSAEGLPYLWLFIRDEEAGFTEGEQWVRVGPETFLSWPELSPRIEKRLTVAEATSGGARLRLIRVPGAGDGPVRVWALFDIPEKDAAGVMKAFPKVGMRIDRADGSRDRVRMALPANPRSRSAGRAYYLLHALQPARDAIEVSDGPTARGVSATIVVTPAEGDPLRASLEFGSR